MSVSLRIALAGVALAALALPAASASASPSAASGGPGVCAVHAPEAAGRSGLQVDVIRRVMHAESRGQPRAISHKGATGCMQIMPPTWAYLTRRYSLGSDPWNPRMNMIGGALYLAELARQFGFPAAYSAYNAGPGRYQRYVRNGVPLPAETIAYAAQITGGAALPARSPVPGQAAAASRWQEARLFMVSAQVAPSTRNDGDVTASEDRGRSDLPSANALFPVLRPAVASRQN
jgi:soluble lytic murein transglycosylase-like protein